MQSRVRQEWLPWAGVGLAALAIQAVLIATTASSPYFAFPLIDSSTYHQMAEAFLKGSTPATPYWQPPLYPWFLAGVYGIVGKSMVAARLAHGLVGVAGVLLTMALATRLAGRRGGLVVGLAAAGYGPLLFFETQLMPVGLAVVLNLALALQVVRALERPSPVRWGGAGLLLGLAALAVPNALVMALVALPLAWRTGRAAGGPARACRWAAVFLAGVTLVVAPVTLRNRIAGGQWVLISGNSGINYYIGNNPHMAITMATRPGLDWDRLIQIPYQHGARKAVEADRYFWAESVRFMLRQPGLYLKGLAAKTRLFFAAREIPRNLDLYSLSPHSTLLALLCWKWRWFAIPFGLVGPLALVGLVVAWRRGGAPRALAGFVILYAASVILFFPTARYRAPLIPFFLLAGWEALVWLARRLREPGPAWWGGVAGLGLAVLLVNAPVEAPTDKVRFDAELENAVGAAFQTRGDRVAALRHYRRARDADPELADAAYNMGVLLGELQRREESMQAYREALRIRPDHDKARINLGVALYRAGKPAEAADMLEMATMLNPGNARAWHNRAMALEAMGRHLEALNCWREAAARDPAYGIVVKRMEQKGKDGPR